MSWSNAITEVDEGFHPRTEDPWWNESSFASFRIPERELFGVLYFYFRPNQKTAMGGPWIVDPHGDEFATCLHDGWDWHMPMPEDAEMFDFRSENGFTVETIQPQQSYRYVYDTDDCSFDLTFTADRAPIGMLSEENIGMQDYVQETEGYSVGHYEQTGVMNGSLVVVGDSIDVVDSAVIRDRTWGPRRILNSERKVRGGYLFGRADKDNSFSAFVTNDLPWEEDPIVGTSERVTSGFYVEDGVPGRLVSGTRRVVERDPAGRPMRETLQATDEHGRTLEAEGEIVCHLKWNTLFGGVLMFWCYENWTLNGRANVPGELQEWFMSRQWGRWRRAVGKAGSTQSSTAEIRGGVQS